MPAAFFARFMQIAVDATSLQFVAYDDLNEAGRKNVPSGIASLLPGCCS